MAQYLARETFGKWHWWCGKTEVCYMATQIKPSILEGCSLKLRISKRRQNIPFWRKLLKTTIMVIPHASRTVVDTRNMGGMH